MALSVVTRGYLVGNSNLIVTRGYVPAAATISVILTDASNAPIAGLTGLRWAWWDSPVVSSQVAPTVKGTGATTNGSGVFSVTTLSGSALGAGGIGWLEITDSTGSISQSPVGKVAGGPIQVT